MVSPACCSDKPRCASLLRRQLVRRSVALYLLCLRRRALAAGRGLYHGAPRYGHLAVAGTIASGALNALLIQRIDWRIAVGRMLLIKCALVAGMVVLR